MLWTIRVPHLRVLAGILAIAATGWGVFCAVAILTAPAFVILFTPGYAITAGYLWMAFGKPHAGWRRAIWFASVCVQGVWLTWALVSVVQGSWFRGGGAFSVLSLSWWAFAVIASFYGLIAEPDRQHA